MSDCQRELPAVWWSDARCNKCGSAYELRKLTWIDEKTGKLDVHNVAICPKCEPNAGMIP